MNWRDIGSDEEKIRLLCAAYGEHVPDYLLYLLPGGAEPFGPNARRDVARRCFPGRTPLMGDMEIHHRRVQGGVEQPTGSQLLRLSGVVGVPEFLLLRLRGATARPAAVEVNGIRCPLIQFGSFIDLAEAGHDGITPRCVNFILLWGWYG